MIGWLNSRTKIHPHLKDCIHCATCTQTRLSNNERRESRTRLKDTHKSTNLVKQLIKVRRPEHLDKRPPASHQSSFSKFSNSYYNIQTVLQALRTPIALLCPFSYRTHSISHDPHQRAHDPAGRKPEIQKRRYVHHALLMPGLQLPGTIL